MRRVRPDADSPAKPKRKLSQRATQDEDNLRGPKPGLETPHPHISQMFIGKHNEVAVELSRSLRPEIARRIGVRRGRHW